MGFDERMARALIDCEKDFLSADWIPVKLNHQLTCDFYSAFPPIDRLEMKLHLTGDGGDRASFALLMRILGMKQRWRIYGLDWNPAGRHVNPFSIGHRWSGRIFMPGETHEHHFEDRVTDDNPHQFGRPIGADLPTYDLALTYFCDTVNIRRPPDLPERPEQRSLI